MPCPQTHAASPTDTHDRRFRGVIIAGNPLAAHALDALVRRQFPTTHVQHRTAHDEVAYNARPWVAVLHIGPTDDLTSDAIRELELHLKPFTPLIVVVAAEQVHLLADLRACGPQWIVACGDHPDDVADTLRHAAECAGIKYGALRRTANALAGVDTNRTALTPRQRQVADLIADGVRNAEIARRLGMTTGTCRAHVSAILKRLGVTSRLQVALQLRP